LREEIVSCQMFVGLGSYWGGESGRTSTEGKGKKKKAEEKQTRQGGGGFNWAAGEAELTFHESEKNT